ncbi:MAG: S41 family peptidase [Candidatus Poribacteria bacterium]|nr:S41 family peptidase [Candidatus Poribacteria bacterium]
MKANRPVITSWFGGVMILGCMLSFIPITVIAQDEEPASSNPLDDELMEQIHLFSEILARTQQDHRDNPEAKQLIYGAIRGMLRTLDPYSQFFEPENFAELREENRGTYGGLGMAIGIRDNRLTVITPFKNTPAGQAGIQSGDVIDEIEEKETANMTLEEAVKLLRGEPGTQVKVTIIREGELEKLEVTMTRDVIRFPNVESKTLKGNIGYIRINQFRQTTAADVDDVFKTFNQQDIRGIILDLRSNPGGILQSAVEIASYFLEPEQLIVYTQGKQPRQNFVAIEAKLQKHYPLVVLVNYGSASGSEIVAAAIKDHGRGLVMGQKTYGKASVQQIFPLSGGAAVKLTTAHYYSPSGVDIHDEGISPNIELPWFNRSEARMLEKLRTNEKIKAFIEENGDDILNQLEKARAAPRNDAEAKALLKKFRQLVDSLANDQIILSDAGIELAIARQTENDLDQYEFDPQISLAIQQLQAGALLQTMYE